jgi:hypothetical protein
LSLNLRAKGIEYSSTTFSAYLALLVCGSNILDRPQSSTVLLSLATVVILDFEARSIEYHELLLPLFTAVLAIFIAVFAVVIFFLKQRWFQSGPGDALAAEGKVCDLAAIPGCFRPAAWLAFAEIKFREKAVASQRRCFDLLLAAMPEKILGPDHGRGGELSIRHSEG